MRSLPDTFVVERTERAGIVRWWYHLVALPEPPPGASLAAREMARRSRLIAIFLLVLLFIEAGALFQYTVIDNDHPRMIALVGLALALTAVIAVLNRVGRISLAGILLALVADVSLPGIPATGTTDLLHLGAFYLCIGSVLVAASVLPAWSVFPVAAANSGAILGILLLLPRTPRLSADLASNNGQQLLAGPLIMQLIVAVVAYLWARSINTALMRADRAEEIAALERRELERQAELEEGVRDLLAVHVRLANGDFQARTPQLRNGLLWQVGHSLNMLIARLASTAQSDAILRREAEEAAQLADAIHWARNGRAPQWPARSGIPLDAVVEALRAGPLPLGGVSSRQSGTLSEPRMPGAGDLPHM
jgi:hypothetical protein